MEIWFGLIISLPGSCLNSTYPLSGGGESDPRMSGMNHFSLHGHGKIAPLALTWGYLAVMQERACLALFLL